jgi:HlyD family secretion protein
LLGVKTSIKSYKDAFLNSDLDIQAQELAVRQKENSLQDAKDKLADYIVRAPFEGTIAKINIKNRDTISAGTSVATLISKKQLAEISMNEVDVAKIKNGEKATLTFDAIPDLTISGIVGDIDGVGTVSQGVVTYIVKISFDTQDSRVKPGMSVSTAITTDMKEGMLFVPNSAVKIKNGENYVEINPPLLTKVPVEIGLSNDTQTEIISGLKEGDEIISRTILGTATTAKTSAPSLFTNMGNNKNGGTTRIQAR